jgi:phosphatidylglycerol:prolipoprotein diacylglycerol transferase
MLWSGLSSFGGFFGAIAGAVGWKYLELKKVFSIGEWSLARPVRRAQPMPILGFCDVVLAVFPIAWSFGRAGCAVVHDHPGIRAARDAWLAVAYGPGPVESYWFIALRHGREPRYDLGFLEMLFAIVMSIAFAATWRRCRADGWYVVAACVLYAPVRFFLDFLRLDDAQGGDLRYWSLTPAQWACIALAVFGAGLAVWIRRRARLECASPDR